MEIPCLPTKSFLYPLLLIQFSAETWNNGNLQKGYDSDRIHRSLGRAWLCPAANFGMWKSSADRTWKTNSIELLHGITVGNRTPILWKNLWFLVQIWAWFFPIWAACESQCMPWTTKDQDMGTHTFNLVLECWFVGWWAILGIVSTGPN